MLAIDDVPTGSATVVPDSFTLPAGDTQVITVAVDGTMMANGWNLGQLHLVGDDVLLPPLRMPVAIRHRGIRRPRESAGCAARVLPPLAGCRSAARFVQWPLVIERLIRVRSIVEFLAGQAQAVEVRDQVRLLARRGAAMELRRGVPILRGSHRLQKTVRAR